MIKSSKNSGGIVFSTNPDFNKTREKVSNNPLTDFNQTIYLHLERKGGGKIVTLIKGFSGSSRNLTAQAKIIKKLCGAGGTAKHGTIIIQGDNRDKIFHYLKDRGHKVKKSGG